MQWREREREEWQQRPWWREPRCGLKRIGQTWLRIEDAFEGMVVVTVMEEKEGEQLVVKHHQGEAETLKGPAWVTLAHDSVIAGAPSVL